jgi:hypothetical protein
VSDYNNTWHEAATTNWCLLTKSPDKIFLFSLIIYRVIGAGVIVAGLYRVLWAKSKEAKSNGDLLSERSLAQNLLHEESYIMMEDL